jgi:hypothetical protein
LQVYVSVVVLVVFCWVVGLGALQGFAPVPVVGVIINCKLTQRALAASTQNPTDAAH